MNSPKGVKAVIPEILSICQNKHDSDDNQVFMDDVKS